jgi:iron complex outermembrane receptor protein
MKTTPSPRISRIASFTLFALALPAQAQTLDDVVVSASRTEQKSFDAPGSIQSVNRDVIESAGPQINISEALAGVPGINVANRNNYSQDLQISIRGFGSRAPFGVRGVRLLIDGIPQTLPDGQGQSSQFALTSAERIEVLKGPISLLYGNAAGGVVQVFTRSAGDKPEFTAYGYAGSDDLYRSSLQYSEKKGPYGLVVDYAYMSSDGFRDYSKARRDHFNGKLEHVSEHGKTTFIANILKNDSEEPGSLDINQYNSNPYQALSNNVSQKFGKEFEQAMLGVTSTRTINANTSVDYRIYAGTRNLDNPLACPKTNAATCITGTDSFTGYSMIERTFYGTAASITRKNSVSGIPVQFTTGFDVDYVIDKRTARQNNAGVPTGDLGRNEENIAYNTDIFAQSQWFLNEKNTALAGVRLTRVKLEVQDKYPSDGNGSGQKDYNGALPVLGLTHHVSPSLNAFIQYGHGFETPTLNEVLYTPNGTATPINAFYSGIAAAKSRQIEIGTKWRPNQATKIDASLFRTKTKDDIVPYFLSTSSSAWQNADTLRQGFELSAQSLLNKNWLLTAAYTYLDASYEESVITVRSGTETTANAGNQMPGIPKTKALIDLRWRSKGWATQSNTDYSEIGAQIVHSGEMQANSVNTEQASGYEILNLQASKHYVFGTQRISVFGRLENVTNEKYVGSVVADQAFLRYYEPGAPRNWLLGLKYTVQM